MDKAEALEMVAERLGDLTLQRDARGLTLDHVAMRTGIDRAIWSRVERGLMPFLERHQRALAELYGVPLEDVAKWRPAQVGADFADVTKAS